MNLKIKRILGESRPAKKEEKRANIERGRSKRNRRKRRKRRGRGKEEKKDRMKEKKGGKRKIKSNDMRRTRRKSGLRTGRRGTCVVSKGGGVREWSSWVERVLARREAREVGGRRCNREGVESDSGRGEGRTTRRRCVSLLAPANCRGQSALADELTEPNRSKHCESNSVLHRAGFSRLYSPASAAYTIMRAESARCFLIPFEFSVYAMWS